MQHITIRTADTVVSPFAAETYALLAEYAKAGHIPPLDPAYLLGDAAGIVLACDGLIALAESPSWDQCDAKLVLSTIEVNGMHAVLPSTVHAVLAFRRWLRATGRSGEEGIDSLEELAGTLEKHHLTAPPRASRTDRRAAAAAARRHARRRSH